MMGVEESWEERKEARKVDRKGRDCWAGGGILDEVGCVMLMLMLTVQGRCAVRSMSIYGPAGGCRVIA